MDTERKQNWSHHDFPKEIFCYCCFSSMCPCPYNNSHMVQILWFICKQLQFHQSFICSQVFLLASDYLPLSLQLLVQLKLPYPCCQLSSSGKFFAFLYCFSLYKSNYFPSALIFLKCNEGRWSLHLSVLEGVSNPLTPNRGVELRV